MTLAQIGGEHIKYYLVPKEIIYSYELDYRRIIYYSFFASRMGVSNEVGFMKDYLIEWTGFKPSRNKTSVEYQTIMSHFIDNNYLDIRESNMDKSFLLATTKEKFNNIRELFAIIYMDELDKILNCSKYIKDTNKTTPATLLLLLAYFRLNIMRRGKDYYGEDSDKPEFCFRMFNTIAEDIGLSPRSVSKGVKQLSDLEIIEYESLPRFKTPNNEWHTHVTIFVDKYRRDKEGDTIVTYNYKQELEWGKSYVLQSKNQSKYKQSI